MEKNQPFRNSITPALASKQLYSEIEVPTWEVKMQRDRLIGQCMIVVFIVVQPV